MWGWWPDKMCCWCGWCCCCWDCCWAAAAATAAAVGIPAKLTHGTRNGCCIFIVVEKWKQSCKNGKISFSDNSIKTSRTRALKTDGLSIKKILRQKWWKNLSLAVVVVAAADAVVVVNDLWASSFVHSSDLRAIYFSFSSNWPSSVSFVP